MPSKNTKFYSLILLLADVVVLLLAFGVAYILRVQYDQRPLLNQVYAQQYFLTFALIAFLVALEGFVPEEHTFLHPRPVFDRNRVFEPENDRLLRR